MIRLTAVTMLIGSMALVAGCASVYHPANLDGGYSESQLDRNVFRVTVKGNLRSTQDETNEMALLRSAEVALQNGYPWFTTSGYSATGTAISLATNAVPVPATTMTIVGYVERPDTNVVVQDADRIVTTLGAKYRRKE